MPTYTYGCGECGFEEDMIKTMAEMEEFKKFLPASCPKCGAGKSYVMMISFPNFRMGKKGFHSTKQGMKRKAEMTRRNEQMEHSQWENVEPVSVVDPDRVVNPTRGGVYDPSSRRFVGRKR